MPGSWVISTTIRSDSTRVPPVTAERSPPDSRITGADSPVIADSSTEAMPVDHGAVAGDHLTGLDDDDVAALQLRSGDLAAARQPRGRLGAHRPQRRRLGAAAALGERLGEVGEDDRQPQPDGDREREPGRLVTAAQRLAAEELISHAIVVISAPTSTTNMTGLRTCTRGSSLVNECPIAGHRISGVNRDFEPRGACGAGVWGGVSRAVIARPVRVELGRVHARLAEQAEEAPVGVRP